MSNTNSVSVGPPHASGWNWVEKNGLTLCVFHFFFDDGGVVACGYLVVAVKGGKIL